MANNENNKEFPSVRIAWASHIYGNTHSNPYNISISCNKVFTYLAIK